MSRGDDDGPRPPVPADELGYGEALDELEAILAELEVDDTDVDVLAERVRRAAELVRVCRGRIEAARFEVEQVVAELDAGPVEARAGSRPLDHGDADVGSDG